MCPRPPPPPPHTQTHAGLQPHTHLCTLCACKAQAEEFWPLHLVRKVYAAPHHCFFAAAVLLNLCAGDDCTELGEVGGVCVSVYEWVGECGVVAGAAARTMPD
jgi:hypothetical protein